MPLCGLRQRENNDRVKSFEPLRCKHPPKYLYRIQHENSQARFDQWGNLNAALNDQTPESSYEFKSALARHLRWGFSRGESYFLSLFGKESEAREWASLRANEQRIEESGGHRRREGRGVVKMYKIHTAGMRKEGIVVMRADKAIQKLEIEDEEHRRHEFIILNRLPRAAIEFVDEIHPPPRPPTRQKETHRRPPSYLQRALKRQSRCLALLDGGGGGGGSSSSQHIRGVSHESDFTLSLDLVEHSFESMFDDFEQMKEERRDGYRSGVGRVDSLLEEGGRERVHEEEGDPRHEFRAGEVD
ncbi:Hypothetical predicted protein [Lecanosticta acicola]|uniref:DUF7587 domain-containing protein n=1 Tax=Lecanosticta acicola TaxID=111012 RepID=A0AAI8Z979_9PEZI|nr:Hypothetical predicted protein [Lecanosticta acicola]